MSRMDVNRKKIIVVGAGPSGCSAAITASNAGHDVVLIETRSREAIIEKSPTSFEAFQNLTSNGDALEYLSGYGIDIDPEYPYKGARVYGPSGKCTEIKLKRPHGYFIRRGGKGSLDHQLIEKVEDLGIEIRFETTLLKARDNGWITCRGNKRKTTKRCDIIIGSDGLGSVVERGINNPLTNLDLAVGIGYHFKGDHGFEPGIAECLLGSHLCPGEYAYVLPTENELSIVTTMRPHLMKTGTKPMDYLHRFMSIPTLREKLHDAQIMNIIMGGVPVTDGGPMGRNRILLTGEAARLTDPMLGFGMVNSLISGSIAATCVAGNDPLREYTASMERSILPDLRSRLRIRNDILDRIDDRSLDQVVDAVNTITRRSEPDAFFDKRTRRKALISSFPDLIGNGGIRTAMKYLVPILTSNFSI